MAGLISVDRALELLDASQLVLLAEDVALGECLGRKLAQDVIARVTLPPHDVSAMDGYAVRFVDVRAVHASLEVIGEAPAGAPFAGSVGAGEAVRIFTGSVIPLGADHVIIQEDTHRHGKRVEVTQPQSAPRHIRRAGGDFAVGDLLVEAGTRMGPNHIAAAAAADHGRLSVYRKPRIAIIANGNELRAPGSNPILGEVVASNYFGLAALIERWGGVPVDLGIARDAVADICKLVQRVEDADIIVPVGGASVGDHDHMVAAFETLGLEMIFRKIAVKPGKPVWFGKLGQQLVLGLPGNPASAYVCAQLFLRTLWGDGPFEGAHTAVLEHDLSAGGGRETFDRARRNIAGDGTVRVTVLSRQSSALVTPFIDANCMVRRMIGAPPLSAGDAVQVFPLTE